jgi:hypothetical protein
MSDKKTTIRIIRYKNQFVMTKADFREYFHEDCDDYLHELEEDDIVEVDYSITPCKGMSKCYYNVHWKLDMRDWTIDTSKYRCVSSKKECVNGSSYFALASCNWDTYDDDE